MDFFSPKQLEQKILEAWQKLPPEDIVKKVKNNPNLSQLLLNNLDEETNPSLYAKFKTQYKDTLDKFKAELQETIEAPPKSPRP